MCEIYYNAKFRVSYISRFVAKVLAQIKEYLIPEKYVPQNNYYLCYSYVMADQFDL